MTDLVGLLSDYGQVQPRRAHGGIYALAGFNYQLRAYVARLVESLGRDDQTMEDAGQVFVEALSDLAEHTGDDKLIFIQAKRTLTGAALKDAADELLAIDRFLQQTHPEWHAKTHFELIASQGKPLGWTDLPASHPAHTTVQRLLAEDRLRPPRIEPDPGWRAIAAVWNTLNDPYGFVRFALDRALGRTTSADDAQRVRDDICERYAEHRRTAAYPGSLLTEQDFVPNPHPSPTLEIGREITLARLRDQQYMPRPHRRDATLASLLTREDLRHRDLQCAARVFWLAGRSGVGKSVLLLQVVERLVLDGRRVLWLGGHAEHLEPALRALADAPADLCPEFIAIDDLYDRDARTRLDLESLGTFIDECGYRVWPLILSCGPAEFAEAFEEDSRYRGFEVHRETVQPIAESETHEIEDWYRHRTEREPLRGAAFEQTHEADGGLFISLAVELTHGDLRQFAQRFSDRVRINKLEEALRLPLALNRLYLRAPYDWLSEADREKLASLNMDGDFRLLDAGQAGQIIRLTHPHLADALYRALRKPANAEAYTNDLVAIFQRALDESDTNLVLQLLRLFSAQRHGLAGERLTITDEALLADRCAKAWKQHPTLALDADGTAVAATSWACWARQQPRIETLLGSNLATDALATLNDAPSVWPYCWMQLATGTSQQPALVAWASKHLSDPLRLRHPMWSRIWEHCLTISADTGPWRTLGLDWLQCRLRRPDWHYVWKKLLPAAPAADWQNDPILILGQRRLHAERDGLDWAYVLEDLFPLATPDGALARELAILGLDWLAGREERAEWSYVWRTLLSDTGALPPSLPIADLLGLGHAWLMGREERPEWSYVWRALLANAQALPPSLPVADLLGLGHAWLMGREERPEWTHVWQALLHKAEALPPSLPLADLLALGHAWLTGREERPEWSYVWRALLANAEALPPSLPLADLLALGHAWLTGREERPEWSYVWQTLLANAQALPPSLPVADLLGLGHAWLMGREERPEWTHVWQALLHKAEALPPSLPLADLLALGHAWLTGREERPEWSYVWRALLANAEALPPSLPLADLLALGHAWLTGREERPEWAHVWQTLLANAQALPPSLPLADLLALGHAWLTGREEQAEWAHIWQDLVANTHALPSSLPLTDLLQQGFGWLQAREVRDEWGFVCEALLDRAYAEHAFIETAALWLVGAGKNKRSWPILAAKFIVTAPQHPASRVFAVKLTHRLNASVNNGQWKKIEPLLDRLEAFPTAVPLEILNLHQSVANRKASPAWEIARQLKADNRTVQGTITAVKTDFCAVELAIGLLARWPQRNNGLSRTANGLQKAFFIQQITPDKDYVEVSTEKPQRIEAGRIYEGQVIEQRDYGLIIDVDAQRGLLHCSQCINFGALRARHPKGSTIRVKVLREKDKGLELTVADDETTQTEEEKTVQIGGRADAVIRGIQEYGLFVRIGKHNGLIHRSTFSGGKAFKPSDYSVGTEIRVQVVGIRADGKLELAPAEQSPDGCRAAPRTGRRG